MRVIVITTDRKNFIVYHNPDVQLKYNQETNTDRMIVTKQDGMNDIFEDIPSKVAMEIASILQAEKNTFIIDFSKLTKKGKE